MGQLKILELRDRAKSALGPNFDLRAFHDVVLDSGALPLDVLEAQVNAWIQSQPRTEHPQRTVVILSAAPLQLSF